MIPTPGQDAASAQALPGLARAGNLPLIPLLGAFVPSSLTQKSCETPRHHAVITLQGYQPAEKGRAPQCTCLQQGRKKDRKKKGGAGRKNGVNCPYLPWSQMVLGPGAAGSSLLPGVRPAAGSIAELLCSSPGALPVWFCSFYFFFFPRKIQSETRWQQHVTNHCLSRMPPPVAGHNTVPAQGWGHNAGRGFGMRFWKSGQTKLCRGVDAMPLAWLLPGPRSRCPPAVPSWHCQQLAALSIALPQAPAGRKARARTNVPCPLFLNTPLQALGAEGSGQPCTAGHHFFLGARQQKILCCPGADGDAKSATKPPGTSMCVHAPVLAVGQSIRGEAGGRGRHTSPPLHPWDSFHSPGGSERGSEGSTGCFFSSQCTLDRSKGGKATGGRAEFGEQQLPPMQAAWPHAPRAEGDSGPLTPKNHGGGDGKVKDPRVPQPKAQQPQVGERRRSRGLPWEASRASSSSSGGVTRSISAPRSTAQHRRARRKFHCAAERSSVSTPRRPAGARSFPLSLPSPAAPREELEEQLACNLCFSVCFFLIYFPCGCKGLVGR